MFSTRKAAGQAGLVAAMLAGGLVVGALTPAASMSAGEGSGLAAVLQRADGTVLGRAALAERPEATLLTLTMLGGDPGNYRLQLASGGCAAPGEPLAGLKLAPDGAATLDARAAEIARPPRLGDALTLSARDGETIACGVFRRN